VSASAQVVAVPDRAVVLAELTQTVLAGRNLLVTGPPGIGKTWLAKAAIASADAAGRPSKAIFGTTSSHEVPLAALSPFLTGTETPAENGLLLARAREAIAATLAASGVTLLLVDDAHLLDGLSGLVLRQLMDFQGLQVVLVTRVAADLPPALRNFADGDNMVAVEISPLDETGTTVLLESTLGGHVSARASERLHHLSVGSPLVLRELIRVGLANDSLRQHRGVWQLDGALPADAQLAELVSLRLSALDDGRREALELVALSEPLDFDTLLRLTGGPVVEWLEQQGLITIAASPTAAQSAAVPYAAARNLVGAARPQVRLAHPLYGEWLQSALPASRRRRLAGQLVASSPPSNKSSDHAPAEPLRVALLRVQAGLATDPMALMGAGRAAMRHDAAAAHTLLRAAVTAGGGVPAQLALAEATALSHPEQTRALLAELAAGPLPDELALAVMALSAMVATLDGDDPTQLLAPAGDVQSAPPPIQLAAALAHLLGGDARQAVALAEPLATSPQMPGFARWRAAVCAVAGMATTGQLDAAVQLSDRTFAELGDEPDSGGFDVAALLSAVILAHERRGDLRTADTIAREALVRPGTDDAARARPRMLQCMARVAMLRGEPTIAARQMREVLSDLGGSDEAFAAWNLGLLAVADALRGRVDLAMQSLAEMDSAPHDLVVYRPEQELCRADVLACAGDLPGARSAASRAAASAWSVGQAPVALMAWNAVARYGDPRAARDGARLAAECVDGPLAPLLASTVDALAESNASGLIDVGDSLLLLGFRPLAADAYASAASLFARRGDIPGEIRAAERLASVLHAGEPIAVPSASVLSTARTLTARERDVASLAATGVSDIVIAQRLGLSVRTVQTHLAHVYTKTNTHGRRGLAELLNFPTQSTGSSDKPTHG
jgi:DNA-binding CsgD family transcriptional regulator/type II secretory pathway predicted ATPase ExeA